MQSKLSSLKSTILKEVHAAKSVNELKEVEVKFMGRKGEVTDLMKTLKDLPAEEKPTIGKQIQEFKNEVESEFKMKLNELETAEINAQLTADFFDLTLPGTRPELGTIHPLTQVQNDLQEIFGDMGFSVVDGPEVESEYYNFEALNIPATHPARDMQDTFFIDANTDPKHGQLLLRTHTSPVQIRTMLKFGAPLRMIVPGRVFRYEATDAKHDSTFYQLEGMLIDTNISLAHFKGIVNELLNRFFKKEVQIRIRPGYFPFVEPGIEIDILWKKDSHGNDIWLEVMPAGMVHPNVLKAGGIDPEKHQGFAFGFGLTRMAMLKFALDDIRLIHGNDLRFLKQF